MKVVAIVPAWQARDRLPSVLGALDGQVAATIVVDNGSTDGTAAWLSDREASVELIANGENRGYPAAVNQGLHIAMVAGADAVLLANDDVVFEHGAVALLTLALHDRPDAGAATPKMRYLDRPGVLNGTGGKYSPARGWAALRGEGEVDRGQYDHLPEADYPSGGSGLLRASVLQEVGFFDEAYFLYYEDVDWGLRAARAGWRTLYVPAALALHGGSTGTAGDPARRRYYNVRNRLRFARRHAPAVGRACAWLATLGLLVKQPLRWPFASRRRDAEAVAWAVADHLRGRYGRSARFG